MSSRLMNVLVLGASVITHVITLKCSGAFITGTLVNDIFWDICRRVQVIASSA